MSALNRLMDEDPTIIVTKNPVTKETLISGMGDQHIDIIMERMQRKFGVEAVLKAPIIEYRETIRGSAEVEGKHKKQSGGHGQYGHVVIKMEPLPPGGGFEFVDKISVAQYLANISLLLKRVRAKLWKRVSLQAIRL